MNWFKTKYTEAQLNAIDFEFDRNPSGTILYLKGLSDNTYLQIMNVPRVGNKRIIKKLNQRSDG